MKHTIWMMLFIVAVLVAPTLAAENDLTADVQKQLANKFCPSLVLEDGDHGVRPEPVEIMGPIWLWTINIFDGNESISFLVEVSAAPLI